MSEERTDIPIPVLGGALIILMVAIAYLSVEIWGFPDSLMTCEKNNDYQCEQKCVKSCAKYECSFGYAVREFFR